MGSGMVVVERVLGDVGLMDGWVVYWGVTGWLVCLLLDYGFLL